jgi:hypothetical protein
MDITGRLIKGRDQAVKLFRRREPAPEDPKDCDEPEVEFEGKLKELQTALRESRWEARGEPFRGFGSPPGRF